MKLILLMSVAFAMSAAEAGEYLFQPEVGVTALSAQVGYRRTQVLRNDDAGEDPTTVDGIYRNGVRLDVGISERVSLGAALSYTDLQVRSDTRGHQKGLEPIQLFLRGQETLPQLRLLYGLDVQFAVDKGEVRHEILSTRALGDPIDGVNQALTVTPYLGVDTTLGADRMGASVAYDIYKMDTHFDAYASNGQKYKFIMAKGPRSILSGFYEHQFKGVLLGVDLGWIKQWELKYKGPIETTVAPGFGLFRAEIYANLTLTPTASLVPTLSSTSSLFAHAPDHFDDVRLLVAYRQKF